MLSKKTIQETYHCHDLPSLLTVEEMAHILRISRVKAYQIIKMPGFPAIKIRRSIRIPAQDLFNWLYSQGGNDIT